MLHKRAKPALPPISVHGCVAQMSFGGHHALNASDQMQKKLQEAMATEELQDALAGIEITDDDDRSDVSMEQRIAEEIVSIASSAASMERQALEQRVVELETQLLRTNAQRTAARAATAAELLIDTPSEF
jgi:5'-3' exonuclease